ncbi:MAG TPA: arginine deiminase family protein [Thermomicrobiales bacterium]|nr:arginine deiminase family protein [Thermomicrobiales bacterium]
MAVDRVSNPDAVDWSYYQSFCPPEPQPPFTDPAEMVRVWGRNWGANSEVGALRMVLMRRPGDEMRVVRPGTYVEAAGGLVDPDGRWYWLDREPPDIPLMQAQHDALAAALADEGVDVVYIEGVSGPFVKSVFTRDPLITVPGGAIILRLAPRMRRGEEAWATKAVAALGMPILGTITGTGMLEGGSFVKLTPTVAAIGTSIRCNDEGAGQLREMLARIGIELIVVPMTAWSIHIDGHLAMVDVDKALIQPGGLPYWFIERLRALGLETIVAHPEERWSINSLCVRPGHIFMSEGSPRTVERLQRRGVEVTAMAYGEVQKNGGGIHCSTMELMRDRV